MQKIDNMFVISNLIEVKEIVNGGKVHYWGLG